MQRLAKSRCYDCTVEVPSNDSVLLYESNLSVSHMYCNTLKAHKKISQAAGVRQERGVYDERALEKRKLGHSRASGLGQIDFSIDLFSKDHPKFLTRFHKLLEVNLFDTTLLFKDLKTFGAQRLDNFHQLVKVSFIRYGSEPDYSTLLSVLRLSLMVDHYAFSMLAVFSKEEYQLHGDRIRKSVIQSLEFVEDKIGIISECEEMNAGVRGTLSAYRALLSALKMVHVHRTVDEPKRKDLLEEFQVGWKIFLNSPLVKKKVSLYVI